MFRRKMSLVAGMIHGRSGVIETGSQGVADEGHLGTVGSDRQTETEPPESTAKRVPRHSGGSPFNTSTARIEAGPGQRRIPKEDVVGRAARLVVINRHVGVKKLAFRLLTKATCKPSALSTGLEKGELVAVAMMLN